MKKAVFLLTGIIGFYGISLIRAQQNKAQWAETVAQYMKDVEDKTITQPGYLTNEWFKLKADKFDLAAEEFRAQADAMPNKRAKKQYVKLAQDMQSLAKQLRSVPIPKETQKSLKNVSQWFKLKARKAALAAEQLKLIGDQTGSSAAQTISARMKGMAETLNGALEKAHPSQAVIHPFAG